LRGRIQPSNREGFALSLYGDAGWGRLVAAGKYEGGQFDPALVQATVEFIQRQWKPIPRPRWLTPVPSNSRPGLLGEFGRAVASSLGIPYREVLAAASGLPQKTMENSAQQLRNVHGRLKVVSDVPAYPVLLIDDVVDSGWTLTFAGWLLREHGAGDVFPFALADSSNRRGT
jgi:ATP-dependent DNA helicase RecQ